MAGTSLRDAVVAVLGRLAADPAALDELRALYAADMVFQDPIQKVEGLEEFLAVNRRLIARSRELSFVPDRVVGDDAEFFVTWRLRLRPKVGPAIEIDGVSHLRAAGGKIREHRDYWDLANMFASAVPGGERVLRVLLKPLA